jgi:hypothetical protein
MQRRLTSLEVDWSQDAPEARMWLGWTDGAREVLDFATCADLVKAYQELKGLAPQLARVLPLRRHCA